MASLPEGQNFTSKKMGNEETRKRQQEHARFSATSVTTVQLDVSRHWADRLRVFLSMGEFFSKTKMLFQILRVLH